MYKQTELAKLERQLETEGKWIARGSRKHARNGDYEYHPTPEKIEAKCGLIRTIDNWQVACARAPRGGQYAVMESKGLYPTFSTVLLLLALT